MKTMEQIKRYGMILLGCMLSAISFRLFLVPSNIAAGGFSGLSMVLRVLVPLPVGVWLLILNAPLFVLGFMKLGKEFVLTSLFCIILFALIVDYLPLPILTQTPMLAAIYGGVGTGFGFGLVLKAGSTTGGVDMLAKLISLKMRQFPIGKLMFFMDMVVIFCSVFIIGFEPGMYAILTVFISGRMVDMVIEGTNKSKAFFIITGEPEKISEQIMNRLERGVTRWSGKGLYSGQDKTILLCALSDRSEVVQMKDIIKKIDRHAFVLVADMTEVLGEGFYDITKER